MDGQTLKKETEILLMVNKKVISENQRELKKKLKKKASRRELSKRFALETVTIVEFSEHILGVSKSVFHPIVT